MPNMTKAEYERMAHYLSLHSPEDNAPDADSYKQARGIFAPSDTPAEVSIRQLRGGEEAPAQMAEHRRVLELEAQIAKYEAALQQIIECDTTEGLEADNEFFDGVGVAETALKEIARKALGR